MYVNEYKVGGKSVWVISTLEASINFVNTREITKGIAENEWNKLGVLISETE
jgi:hypothetical protein